MSSRVSGRKRKEPERLSDESSLAPKKKKGAAVKKTSTKKAASTKKPAAKKAKTTSKKATSTKKAATPKAKKTPSKKTPTKKAASSKKKTPAKASAKKKTPAKKASKKADADDDEEEEEEDDAPPAKASKAKVAPKAKTGSSVTEALYQLGLDELKDRLRANDGLVSGSKKDLIKRIADAVVNGCPPRCPACSGGRLKKSGSTWKCPGYHNGDYFQRCSYSTTTPTLIPWKKADGKDF